MPRKAKKPTIRQAPKVRVPLELLTELDREAARLFPEANLSRIQVVSMALRLWLDAQRSDDGKARR